MIKTNKTYIANGLRFIEVPIDEFKIKFWDKAKRTNLYKDYINGGFFAPYIEKLPSGKKTLFTMPVMNLMCDIDPRVINPVVLHYLDEWTKGSGVSGNKLRIGCAENGGKDFAKREISSLVITKNNKVYIEPMNEVPDDAKYCISGILTLKNKKDVDYYKYVVAKEGVGAGTMYSTWRNWLAIDNEKITIISGKSYTSNYIYTAEIFKKIQKMGIPFISILAMDGGGSMQLTQNGRSVISTWENRQINNIITF